MTAKQTKNETPADSGHEMQDQEPKKVRFRTIMLEGGVKYRTLLTEKFKRREKYEYPDDRKIYSLIPGTVLKICAKEGQEVTEGDNFLVLEAMKMKNKIAFPRGGVVKKIHVVKDQKIGKGKLLIELE